MPTPADLGIAAVKLALDYAQWVTRRVERARFLDDSTVRWQISLSIQWPDPAFFAPAAITPGDVVLAPIALLVKRPLTQLDVRDEQGLPLPTLATRENAHVAIHGLLATIYGLSQDRRKAGLGGESARRIAATVWSPAALGAEIVARALEEGELAEVLKVPDEHRSLFEEMGTQFMMLVPLTYEPGRRTVIKYGFTMPMPRDTRFRDLRLRDPPSRAAAWDAIKNRAARFGLADYKSKFGELPMGLGDSYHFEIEAPDEVRIACARLSAVYPEGGSQISATVDQDGGGPRVHLHARRPTDREFVNLRRDASHRALPWHVRNGIEPTHIPPAQDAVEAALEVPTRTSRSDLGLAEVFFRPPRTGTFFGLVITSVLTAVLIWQATEHLATLDQSIGSAVLLALPAVAFGYLTRTGEHGLATRILVGARALALGATICSLTVALLLALGPLEACAGTSTCPAVFKPHVETIADVCCYGSASAAAILLIAWLRLVFSRTRRRAGMPRAGLR